MAEIVGGDMPLRENVESYTVAVVPSDYSSDPVLVLEVPDTADSLTETGDFVHPLVEGIAAFVVEETCHY